MAIARRLAHMVTATAVVLPLTWGGATTDSVAHGAPAERPAVVDDAARDVQVRHPEANCSAYRVPVSLAMIGPAHIYGELCTPHGASSAQSAVQLLVPGSTYNHIYYDMPVRAGTYSYVSKAIDAGYPTFNIDRLATGRSSLPPSASYTLDAGVEALDQVVTALRSGAIGDRPFDTVVWVGHSLGSSMAWSAAATHCDVDAFVLTGMSHIGQEHGPDDDPAADVQFEIPATRDPMFRDTVGDPGYFTTNAGMRHFFYYEPNADPAVIAADEAHKDLSTAKDTVIPEAVPSQSLSQSVAVPTLLVVGDRDQYCSVPVCTSESLLQHERPYYSPQARLQAIVVADSGHSVQLHGNAVQTNSAILDWLSVAAPPNR